MIVNGIYSTSNGERNATTYTYTTEFLTKLESANTKFKYTYNGQGRKTAIYVNEENKPYVTFKYSVEKHNAHNNMGTVECDVVTSIYASDEVYTSYTDIFGRLLSVHYKSKEKSERVIITNFYDEDRVIKTLDYKTNETITFEYDINGNVIKQTTKGLFTDKLEEIPGQHLSISQDINIDGLVDKLTYEIDNRNQTYKFDFAEEEIEKIHLPSGDTFKVNTDDFGRAKKTSILSKDEMIISNELSFLQHLDSTTNIINSHTQKIGKNNFNKTLYTYDENGNISEIRQAGIIVVRYKYDELNRLIREDNRKLDKTFILSYDNNGNILNKRELSFTLDKILTEGIINNYSYFGESDQLILFNDERFEYDVLGNPTTYRNHNLKWSHLRNLESFNDIEFKYNSSNLRIYKDYQKEIDGVNTRFESRYQWANDRLISETRTSTNNTWLPSNQPTEENHNNLSINTTTTTLDFIYDTNNKIGFTLNGEETYYYVKNIQGDVLKVVTTSGNVVAEYTYDAWGNHEIITSIDGIAELNPIRYRSYYFDKETNLYYLKSRYYDAQIGRFINMDALSYVDPDTIGGLNLYAYCGNNPVMSIDPEGTFFRSIGNWFANNWQTIAIGIAAVAIGIAAVAIGALTFGIGAKVVGVLAKGVKVLGGAVKAGAKKIGQRFAANGITRKDNIIKGTMGAFFGFMDTAWDSDGNFNILRGVGGALTGAIAGVAGGLFKKSRLAVKAIAGTLIGSVSGALKGLINGSSSFRKMIMSTLSGTVGIFTNFMRTDLSLYFLQMVIGATGRNSR